MGPDSGSVERGLSAPVPDPNDPIFRGEEAGDRTTKKATLLFQFFLFPLLIVVAAVGVFLFFGLIGGSNKSMDEYLDDVLAGGLNSGQSAQQLAALVKEEWVRVHDEGAKDRAPPSYSRPQFRQKLERAFVQSFESDHDTPRRVFLATTLGLVGAPEFLPVLRERLFTPEGKDPIDDFEDVRRACVFAIANLDTPDIAPVLAGLVKDTDESVANFAVKGLARWKTPESIAGLKVALAQGSEYVRDNAALALAVLGDPAGLDLLERLLDPAEVERKVSRPAPSGSGGGNLSPAVRRGVLTTAIRGASALKAEGLKSKVEALAKDQDEKVRESARNALDHWN